jgi:hypothetical protein
VTLLHGGRAARRLAAVAAAVLLTARPTQAQEGAQGAQRGLRAELRADAIAARSTAYQVALGAGLPVSNYVRLAGVIGAGMTVPPSPGEARPSARADLMGRFLLDPFREARWGPYAGAGLSVRADVERYFGGGDTTEERVRARGYLLLALGIEGPEVGNRVMPALEVGFGGGTRVGVVLRQARAGRR